jgi:hypothetical protein
MSDNKPLFEKFCEYFKENTDVYYEDALGKKHPDACDYSYIRNRSPDDIHTETDTIFHIIMKFCDFIGDTPIVNIEKIKMGKGDVIVHRSKHSHSLESIANIHTKLTSLFPENKVLVLDNGEDVEIISGDLIK